LTDPAAVLADARKALPDLPIDVLSLVPQAPRLFDECGVWNVGRADASLLAAARSEVPVLLMAGTFDAVTPPSQAEVAASRLPNSRVLRFPGLDTTCWPRRIAAGG
jgi:pimeloyl-ACP methyl ester carboxylesterase